MVNESISKCCTLPVVRMHWSRAASCTTSLARKFRVAADDCVSQLQDEHPNHSSTRSHALLKGNQRSCRAFFLTFHSHLQEAKQWARKPLIWLPVEQMVPGHSSRRRATGAGEQPECRQAAQLEAAVSGQPDCTHRIRTTAGGCQPRGVREPFQ